MKRELVLAIGILFLGMPTTTPAHTGNSAAREDSFVQFTATVDGVIHFGNRQNNQLKNESMTLVFDDDTAAIDDKNATDDNSSSAQATEDEDVNNVVQFNRMLPLPESMAGGLGDVGVIRGIQPGGRAWKLTNSEGQLQEDGQFKVAVEGLLLEGEDMNTSSSSFRALVSCIGEAGETTFMTPDFPVDELGNAQVEHRFEDIGFCIAPIVFVGSGSDAATGAEGMDDLNTSDFRWFAVTGHSFGAATPAADDNSTGASTTAASSGTVSRNGVPPLSGGFSGAQASTASGIGSGLQSTNTVNGATNNPAGDLPPVTGTIPSRVNSASAAGGREAAVPPVAGLPPTTATSIPGVPTFTEIPPTTGAPAASQPGVSATALPGLSTPPVAGTGTAGALPPVAGTSPIITAPAAPATDPLLGPPDAGTFSAGASDDAFPRSTFDDPVPAPGFTTAPGFPLTSGAFNDTGPFRFDADITDLALASPVF